MTPPPNRQPAHRFARRLRRASASTPLLFGLTGSLASLLVGSLLVPSTAHAQADVERPLPNVMLLVDTSGSMEFRAADNTLPQCSPGNPSGVNQKSRWIDLVEVMTGTIKDYSCFPMDRSSNGFKTEYSIGSQPPYDLNYLNPFNRIVSGGCVYGPGELPTSNPYDFPARGVFRFPFSAPATVTRGNVLTQADCTGWNQTQDGILDVFREKVRFGLMTFDTHLDDGTGLDSSGGIDVADGMRGTWSYFLGSPVEGKPAFCKTSQLQEVGARNAAAPPWEGRMIGFGPPNATTVQLNTRNDHIQDVLLASRPYGATPIAGLLHDAREYFWNDKSKDPLDPDENFGPYDDPTVGATDCRRSLLILLSDGEPNLDLRPHCSQTQPGMAPEEKGVCPYEKPEDVVAQLLEPPPSVDPDRKVETVVIGFALNKVTPSGGTEITCSELTTAHCNDPGNAGDRAIQACCTLNKIAAAGWDTPAGQPAKTAYFPQDSQELKEVFSQILKDVTVNLTTRTSAVFSSSGTSSDGGSHQFSSGFRPLVEEPWAGTLLRKRIVCEAGVPKEQDYEPALGDDFAANLNSGTSERYFYSYVPSDGNAGRTLRADLSSDVDGIGALTGAPTDALTAGNFVSAVPAGVMEVQASHCKGSTDAACRDAILGWTVGLGTNVDGETRCASPGTDCNMFGAIYHSTPRLVTGRPNELLRDESYADYTRSQVTKKRPSVLYAATIDGQLHAFKTAPVSPDPLLEIKTKANNELWSFFPPAVLPVLRSQYPNTPATLLDGPIQTKDVVAREASSGKILFERTQPDAIAGAGDWRTVLLSSFGRGQVGSGFYALDVTDPVRTTAGPKFLWQLTTDASDAPLFGDGGTGLITTVFLKTSSLDPGREIAVAVLPGGDRGTRSSGTASAGPLMDTEDPDFASKTVVNAYSSESIPARSVTIVRLDTGEVLRTFRTSSTSNSIDSNRVTVVDIPAPITGTPAAFPAAAGAVADRIFVGDAEGRVWRIDVSKNLTSEWTMDVFFDTYFDLPDTDVGKRQPIELAPIVSVDEIGRITVNAATGEQRVLAAGSGMINRVVSVTETLEDVLVGGNPSGTKKFTAKFNWVETLGCPTGTCQAGQTEGERVTGPMTLFGGSLFFASSSPPGSTIAQCSNGTNRVWGIDYKLNEDVAEGKAEDDADPMSGAYGALPVPVGQTTPPKTTSPSSGLVFGVAIEQQPSCSVDAETFDGDPYLGNYGNHTATTTITPGKFFLVYQVGGGTGGSEAAVSTDKFELQPPRNSVWVDSWAPVFE